jgi:hypothetical protein
MLNGIDPILIFNISKTVSFLKAATEKKIPVASQILDKIDLPAIPLYLSPEITGLHIDTEDKSLEIETSIETTQDSSEKPFINQRALNNTVKVSMVASKDSIGLTLLSALSDFVFPLVTAKEVTVTYLHGPITVFAGLLHSFNINQVANSTLYTITMELVRTGIQNTKQTPAIENKVITNIQAAAKAAA